VFLKGSAPFLNKWGAIRTFFEKALSPGFEFRSIPMDGIKKAHIDGSFVQTPINRFRANRLLKDPFWKACFYNLNSPFLI
jgi:hypothetical protein